MKKLVIESRGGYCYEQNKLLCGVLLALGCTVDVIEARVLLTCDPSMRTHVLLSVRTQSDQSVPLLVDVALGGESPAIAIPLAGRSH